MIFFFCIIMSHKLCVLLRKRVEMFLDENRDQNKKWLLFCFVLFVLRWIKVIKVKWNEIFTCYLFIWMCQHRLRNNFKINSEKGKNIHNLKKKTKTKTLNNNTCDKMCWFSFLHFRIWFEHFYEFFSVSSSVILVNFNAKHTHIILFFNFQMTRATWNV